MDTVRRDHCSVYDYHKNTTPNLSLISEQGTVFDQAYSPTSTTGPSHATIFTALFPISHQVIKNGIRLSEKYTTIADILSAYDYQTAAIIGSFVLDSKFGYNKGFKYYDDDFKISESMLHVKSWEGFNVEGPFDRRANFITERTIHWLRDIRKPENPFFLFVHYFDPHFPYLPPDPFFSKLAPLKNNPSKLETIIGYYDGEIAFTDHEIGNLLEALKQMNLEEDTLVVITSDHGEGLMEHNHLEHGVNIYEEAVRVPLLFRWPNHIKEGQVISYPVSLISLAPTILELIGINIKEFSFQGKSLADCLIGDSDLNDSNPIYLFRRHYIEGIVQKTWVKGVKLGIRIGDWKYIEGDEEKSKELFNLKSDPQELTNLLTINQKKASELSSLLTKWKVAYSRVDTINSKIPEEDLKRLKTLGYVE